MANTTLNLSIIEKRMLTPSEAAHYCGMAAKHFSALCPVAPLELRPGERRFDKRDLDQWIDTEKSGAADANQDAILRRLG